MSDLREIKAHDKSDVAVNVRSTEGGVLLSSDIRQHWSAKGYGWSTMATAAVASLIVRPSTLSIATFYNNTAKNFVIDRVFAHNLVSIADGQFGIWLCVHPVGAVAFDTPTNDITIRNNLNGNYTAVSEGLFDIEAAVVDNGWFPYGESNYSVTTTVPGSLAQAFIEGRIVLPPTSGLSMSCVGQTAVVTVTMGLTYYAVPVAEYVV